MGLANDLRSEVRSIFVAKWQTRLGGSVPATEDVALGNAAVKLKATVLYADLAESTAMVDVTEADFAAKVYKAYLRTACRIIRSQGGHITAFDGDRVMAVFLGKIKDTQAVTAALKINWAVREVVNEEIARKFKGTDFRVKQAVGVDTSDLWVARTGIRGSNDLVWVGRAANYAAKLCSLRSGDKVTWITQDVYNSLDNSIKYSDGSTMWEQAYWNTHGCLVYSSAYTYSVD